MSSYPPRSEEYNVGWDSSTYSTGLNFDANDMTNFNSDSLNFQSFDGQYAENVGGNFSPNKQSYSFYDPTTAQQDTYAPYADMGAPPSSGGQNEFEEDEPPLLEELGIYPDRIMGKTLMVLNPFQNRSLVDANILCETDLAGPIAFCVLLGSCLLLAGAKAHFGYVYGLVVISCIVMYCLLSLMTTRGNITFGSVVSILGYCLLPVSVLSICGIFLPLHSPMGIVLSMIAVLWSSLSASKLFVTLSEDSQQRPLIAYPCALLYGTFALIIVF